MAAAAFLIFAATPVFSQTESASPTPSPSPTPTPTPVITEAQPAPVDYFLPELKPNVTTLDGKRLKVRVGFALLADYTFIDQDSSSEAQVGPQESKFDLRAARLVFSGEIKFRRPWTFLIGGDFNEFREPEDSIFEGLDYAVTIPLWGKARVAIGKQKEPFVYEMVGDAANLPHQERILSPFFNTRNTGIRYSGNYLKDRMSLSVGIYNDCLKGGLSLEESGTQVSGRLTGLRIWSVNGLEFLHLGVALRYNGADKGQMRFRGRPESNVLDYYVDTGDFPAKYATELALEVLYNTGPLSVLTEYARARVESPERGDPVLAGFMSPAAMS